MSVLVKDLTFVTQYIRKLRGGSQPILVQASDGLLYVVKFANNLQGPNLLFNESAGSELFRSCGLPVPEWRPVKVSNSFLDKNPDCWIQTPEGRLRPSSGLSFGSRFLGGNGKPLLEILPASSFNRVRNQASFWLAWLIDVCAEHGDNRQAIFEEDAEGWLDASFVDHGHLFGGPKADMKRSFCASRYLDPRIYAAVSSEALLGFQSIVRALDVDRLRQRTEAIPAEWRQVSARESFERCLQRLSKPLLVRNVLETIVDAIERRTEKESGNPGRERKPSFEVLRLGVQGAGCEQTYTRNPACA
jgi:hypothetical protein